MIEMKTGNIFTTQCDVIVNTVNCSGIMGAGIAYEFKLRYPEMFNKYKELCDNKLLTIGKLWIYKITEEDKGTEHFSRILNFPTKKLWKLPSKREYLELGLEKFVNTYKEKNISSIAFPLLGASKGNLSENESINIMKYYLENLDIKIEIWHYDPNAYDDLYENFKSIFLSLSDTEIKEHIDLRKTEIDKLRASLQNKHIRNMNSLSQEKGIGDKTLEKSFAFLKKRSNLNQTKETQGDLNFE